MTRLTAVSRQAVIVGGVLTQAEIEAALRVDFNDLAGRGPDLGFDAAAVDRTDHGAILAHQQFRAFLAGDGAVYLHNSRDGALLAQAAQAHDFIVNIG